MKRYMVQVTVGIGAKSEKEAKRIMKQIVESGRAMGSKDGSIAQIKLSEDPLVICEIPF